MLLAFGIPVFGLKGLSVSQAQSHHGTVSDRHRTMLSGAENEMLLSRPLKIFPLLVITSNNKVTNLHSS